MTGSASGSGRRGWKERGNGGSGACTISGGKLTLGTVPGAEEGKEREGEWCGTGAYAADGGMLILELDDGAVGHGGRSGVRPGLWMVLRC